MDTLNKFINEQISKQMRVINLYFPMIESIDLSNSINIVILLNIKAYSNEQIILWFYEVTSIL